MTRGPESHDWRVTTVTRAGCRAGEESGPASPWLDRPRRDWRARYQHLTSREDNKLTPTQAQTVIAAAILRHLHAVITTGQAWDPGTRQSREVSLWPAVL